MHLQNTLRNKLSITVLTSILLFGFKSFHPFYLGIVHLKHNTTNKSIESSVKLFVNDLEDALKKQTNKPIDLINGTNKDELNKLIQGYVKKNLAVKVNNKLIDLNYVGFEVEKEIVWIYSEYKNIKSIQSMQVDCSLLYEHIKQQTNIIRIEVNNNEQSTKLNKPEKTAKFSF
jgi:hypothetical protein